VLPATGTIARLAAEHLRHSRRSRTGIDLVDCPVATTAEPHDAQLVTSSVHHFPMVEGLRAPWEPAGLPWPTACPTRAAVQRRGGRPVGGPLVA
jgi:hypothetical protein